MKTSILVWTLISTILTALLGAANIASAIHPCPPDCEPEPEPCPVQCVTCPCPRNGHHQVQPDHHDMYLHQPKVEFPTTAEVYDYLTEYGIKKEFTLISNSSQNGLPNEIQTAIGGDDSWIAWTTSSSNDTEFNNETEGTSVLVSVSRDGGENFDAPVTLSPQNTTGISNLQLAVSDGGKFVDLAWLAEGNSTNVLFISASSNYGQDFKTYPLVLPGFLNASNPILKADGDNLILVWNQLVGNDQVMYSHSRHW